MRRMADLSEQYASLGLGGPDASIVAIAERVEIAQIATIDCRVSASYLHGKSMFRFLYLTREVLFQPRSGCPDGCPSGFHNHAPQEVRTWSASGSTDERTRQG